MNDNQKDVRCLCGRCVQDYLYSNRYYVERVNRGQNNKEKCDKCNGLGFDYYIIERRKSVGN